MPFFVATVNGKPDLRVASVEKQYRCAAEKLCWVCGQKLEKIIAFIGGPVSTQSHFYSDGPMHQECAEFSLKYCPHMAVPTAKRRDNDLPETISHAPGAVVDRPKTFILCLTPSFQVTKGGDGLLFRAGPTLETSSWESGKKISS